MARYRVEIFKKLGTETWENRYHVETVSFTTAEVLATSIAESEQAFHSEQVFFTYARVSTVVEGDNLFLNIPLNYSGGVPGSTTSGLLPLWNVAKVYFTKDLARPDFKLYRGCLGEGNSESGQLSSNIITALTTNLTPLVTGEEPILFPVSGPAYTGLSVDLFIRQRDVHRRKRRGSTGGLVTP